jgi:hypothetical protein
VEIPPNEAPVGKVDFDEEAQSTLQTFARSRPFHARALHGRKRCTLHAWRDPVHQERLKHGN